MSHTRVKTEYDVEGPYGSTEKQLLYADHNNCSDYVTFYDQRGNWLFCVEDTRNNNMLDAINRLYLSHLNEDKVEKVSSEEWNKVIINKNM